MEIKANGKTHEIEIKPITLLFHPDNVQINTPDGTLEISPTTTVKVATNLPQNTWEEVRTVPEFVKMWKFVFPEGDPPLSLNNASLGYQHIAGLIIMLWWSFSTDTVPFVRFPETYLHPKAQLGLGDLFIYLSTGS